MAGETLGSLVRSALEAANARRRGARRARITQADFARAVGFSQPWVAKFLDDGFMSPPEPDVLRRIAELLTDDLPTLDRIPEADRLFSEMLDVSGYASVPSALSESGEGSPSESDLIRELARYGIDVNVPLPRHALASILDAVRELRLPLVMEGTDERQGGDAPRNGMQSGPGHGEGTGEPHPRQFRAGSR